MSRMYCLSVGCGDATYINTGTASYLVDCNQIESFSDLLPSNKYIDGIFITHQNKDHYSGLTYLHNNNYRIGTLIYSPYSKRYNDNSVTVDEWQEFNTLRDAFVNNGTNAYAPYRQNDLTQPYWRTNNGVDFYILGPYQTIANADDRHIHDACLVIQANIGTRNCVFTGDASDKNLHLVAANTTFGGDILHASHHGSINGADLSFIQKCNPTQVIISTENGVHENVPHPTALQRYRNNSNSIYRTDDTQIERTWWFWDL